jgi:serine/threonine-protein kinase
MTLPVRSADNELPVTLLRQVDDACGRFEAAWQAAAPEERPRIEAFLDAVPEAARPDLVNELVALEIELRRRAGEHAELAEYQARFPSLAPPDRTSPLSRQPVPPAPTAANVAIPGYEVIQELGRGGMGVVYKARQVKAARLVALKVILAGAHAGPEERDRFRTEVEAAARLHHPGIAQVFEVGEHDGLPFFSLEFCEGGSLDHMLAGAPLPAASAARLLQALAQAVQAAHQCGIVHRDLKPANVLLTAAGEPKVADFGLAKKLDASTRTATGAVLGTPSYMAPEQAGGGVVSAATDVYALGAILYECLTGRPPFRAATAVETLRQVAVVEPVPPRRLNPDVPRDLETICLKCLHKDPARRYASAQQLAEDLGRFQAGEPIRARRAGVWERSVKWTRRRPALAGLLAVSVAATLALGIGAWAYNLRLERALKDAREQRARAEQNFREAWQAVDDSFLRVSESRLLRVPGLQPLRKELLQDALKYYRKLLRQRSDDPSLRAVRARAQMSVARILEQIGTNTEAVEAHEQARALLEEVVESDPHERPLQVLLAWTHCWLGTLRVNTNRHQEALASYLRAQGLWEKLVRAAPDDLQALNGQAVTWHNLALFQDQRGRAAEADPLYEQALAGHRRVIEKAPRDPRYQEEFARLCGDLGTRSWGKGAAAQALQWFQKAGAIIQKLVKQHASHPVYQDLLANTWRNIGHAQIVLNQRTEALSSLEQARALWQRLADKNPEVDGYQASLASAWHSLGGLHSTNRQWAEALRCLQRAQALQEKLVSRHRDEVKYQMDFADTCSNIGLVYVSLGKAAEALPFYRRAVARLERLVERNPGGLRLQVELAKAGRFLGIGLRAAGLPAEALAADRKALAAWEKLAAKDRANLRYRSELGATWHGIGQSLKQLGRFEEAREGFEHAVRSGRMAVDKAPEVFNYRVYLANHYFELADLQRHLGQPPEAAAALRKWQELGLRYPPALYTVARAWARCIPLVGKGKPELTAEEQDQRRQYADQAVAALHDAVARGYKDLGVLQKDTALDPLRSREDFRRLLAGLEKKAKPTGK